MFDASADGSIIYYENVLVLMHRKSPYEYRHLHNTTLSHWKKHNYSVCSTVAGSQDFLQTMARLLNRTEPEACHLHL